MFSNRPSVLRGSSLAAAALAAAGLTMSAASTASANVILNGDFSANAAAYTVYPGYSTSPNPSNPTDWLLPSPGNAGINGIDTGFANQGEPFAPTTSDMADMAFLQSQGTSISQTVTTTAGQAYTLTYDAAARSGETADVLNVILTDATNSNQITTQTPAISDASFAPFTVNFVAPSASTTVEFMNNTNSNSAPTVDVSGVSLVAVPEPATLGLVAAGGLGLLLLKRRKAV